MKSQLEQHLDRYHQSHLLRFWDELSDEGKSDLADQIQRIDFDLIQSLLGGHTTDDHWASMAARAVVPPAITLDDLAKETTCAQADAAGQEALRAGKIGMILVAGGQGSRLGFDHPKGMFPIGPISDRTLYQIHFEKILARSKQFGATIPLYVMTSPPTHEETTQFLRQHEYFGLGEDNVKIFCQGVMPAVDQKGKILLEEKGKIFVSPDGHGGTLAALIQNGCLADALERGVEHLFYGQVDNPLIQICDPTLLGFHLNSGSEMTSQVVRKQDPMQKVGNVVQVDGNVHIIEYSDLPEEFARQTNSDGSLKLWAGSIAVHIFSIDFMQRSGARAETLPFHVANKKVPFVAESGELIQPDSPNARKFERFIFDLLPFAENAIVCEVDPADGFCAVKNAPPADSETPQHVRDAIASLHRRWLLEAGAVVDPAIPVEINPLFAPDQKTLSEKIEPGTRITEPTYFQ